ncbi:hydroxyneurosporene methyltransferase [Mycobacterium sp. IS-2888]|uniref:methyltransferase n=1 Tax=unclassified Mycobacterium TaxID=2642494 RepID=UPI00096D13F9|nr:MULTISPECIES: methyltransferase [unclassified Mycobacterium]OMC47073.1 hydroxyneurosporene methyltransferase [Mycobacterium sp. IS-1264]OMC50029.1 hydroxyneurosporene methyltransferase [Mycobacterium sp. IS-2888]
MASNVPPAKVVRGIERARHHLAQLYRRLVPPSVAMIEMIMDAWSAQAITAAADLGIADALAKGPLTVDELAAAVDADPGAIARLLRALIGRGIFRQLRDGRYDLTPLGATLRRDAEVSMAGMARWVGSPQHREHWSHLTEAIRTGRTVVPGLRGKPVFDFLADEPELSEIFNDAMTGTSQLAIAPVIAAYDFGRHSTIVDVGGGHGRLLAAILDAAPQAHGVLFDLPHVVAGAPAVFRENRVEDRVRIVEGSFFDAVPEGGDAYLLKTVIHDWSDDEAARILRNVRTAAGPGKYLLLVEFVIPGHRRDYPGKWVDLEMLVGTDARERTAAEYRDLLSRTGFELTRVVETASPYCVVEGRTI